MRYLVLVPVALVIALTVAAQQAFFPVPSLAAVSLLPLPQQSAIALAGLVGLWLIGSVIWQSQRLARQGLEIRALERRLAGVRQAVMSTDEAQHSVDAAVRALAKADQDETIAPLQERLAAAEHRTAEQQVRQEAVDVLDRVDEIRARQKALRQQITEVADKRRASEPIIGELKERQSQLDHMLDHLDTDDRGRGIGAHLNEFSEFVTGGRVRIKALEDALEALAGLNAEFDKFGAALDPLQRQDTGIAALVNHALAARYQLAKNLDRLERDGDETLAARIDTLLKGRIEVEQRLRDLNDCLTTAQTICRDFGSLQNLQAHLDRSLAQVETDDTGRTLADRQAELGHFVAQTRIRFERVDAAFAALSGLRNELTGHAAALAPLQSPDGGVAALLGEAHALRDRVLRALEELESDGTEPLPVRVEALEKTKRDVERRMAALGACFADLETVRRDIGDLFARLSVDLNAHTALPAGRPDGLDGHRHVPYS